MPGFLEEIHDVMAKIETISAGLGYPILRSNYQIKDLGVPHNIPKLPMGKCAVYLFFYHGAALKIGKVNEKSKARYSYQHYGCQARSTLAKSILADDCFSSENLDKTNVSDWIKTHTHRVDIILDSTCGDAAVELIEAIMHYHFRPKYEGALHRKTHVL